MSELLTIETFAPALGSRFDVTDAGEPVALELVEASPLGEPPPGAARPPFALVFAGPGERPLEQRCHALRHRDLGDLAIFLVPIGVDGEKRLYEAVFA